MRRTVLLAAIAVALGIFLGGTGTGSAAPPTPASETPPPQAPSPKATLVPLTVVEGPSKQGDVSDVSIENIVYGDCGYAWTFLYNTGGNDNIGLIAYGAHSTKGNIVKVSWETHLRKGYFGTLLLYWSGTDWRWPWQGPTWSKSHYFDISPWGDGRYTGNLWYLDVWTALGYRCVGLSPYDYWYIS